MVVKVALVDAAPMALLALKFAAVIAIIAVLFVILRPPYLRRRKIGCMWALLGF